MATLALNDWRLYLDTVHSLALVEDDLRATTAAQDVSEDAAALAQRILWERFDVNAV